MHIAHITEDFSEANAGVTSALAELARIGQRESLTHEIITTGARTIEAPEGVTVTVCAVPRIARSWRWSKELPSAVERAAARGSIIHLHGVWMYPQLAAARIAIARSRPLVITPHNMLGGWLWRRGLLRRLKKTVYWASLAARALTRATVVHALSDIERDNLREFFPTNRIEVIPNGIDVAHIRASAEQAENDTPILGRYLLFLGRLHPVKGIDLLISAFCGVASTRRMPLVIAGPPYSPAYSALLSNQVRRCGLGADVMFIGPTYGRRKLSLIRNAWALVSPSRSEGISMTALEALACGVPVMSSREAGIIELVAGGGVLVEAEVGGIKRGLEEILSWSLEERRSRGAAALSLVQSRYDWRVVERRYAELYATL